MATAFEHISQNFRLTAHGIFKDYVQSWLEKFHPQFETLTKIWAVFQQDYKSLVSNATSPEEIWALMESHINQQIDWITNFENLLKLQDRTQFWILSEQQFKRFMSEYESKVEITVLSSDFDPKPEDRFWESLWKRFQLFKIGILNYSDRFANKLRVLVKKDLREPHRRRFRQISVAQVIKRYLEIPVNQLLVEEWRKIQRTVGRTLHDLHLLSAELKKSTLLPQAQSSFFFKTDQEALITVQTRIEEFCQRLQNLQQDFQINCTQSAESLTGQFDQIVETFKKKWEFSGTSLEPQSRVDVKTTLQEQRKISDSLSESDAKWQNSFCDEFDEWQGDLKLSRLQVRAIRNCVGLLASSKLRIEASIITELDQRATLVTEGVVELNDLESLGKVRFRNALRKLNRRLIESLAQEKTLLIIDEVWQNQLRADFLKYYTDLAKLAESLPEKQTILIKRDLNKLIPDQKIDFVPINELVKIYSVVPLRQELANLVNDNNTSLRKVLRVVSMIDQIIDYNFETGLGLMEKGWHEEIASQVRQTILDGLERSRGQFTDLINDSQAFLFRSHENVLKMTTGFINTIQELEDAEKVYNLKLKLTRGKTREKYRSYRRQVFRSIRLNLLKGLKVLKYIADHLTFSYLRLRKLTGIEKTQIRFEDELLEFMSTTYSPLDKLPIVYQRLFKLEPIGESRFFQNRPSEFDQLQKTYTHWLADPVSTNALIGEKGCGKSTILKYAQRKIFNNTKICEIIMTQTISSDQELLELLVTHLKLEAVNNFDELEARILNQTEQQVVVFENLQRLFIRHVGGFNTLKRFLLFISRTSHRIFWVVSCSLYSWQYLDRVLNISRFFHNIVQMAGLKVDEIEKIIMSRHDASGFDLQFSVPKSISDSSKYRKLQTVDAQQEYLKQFLFENLHSIAAGNISVAMSFWLITITEVRKDELVLAPILDWNRSLFQKLPAEELFTLAAIIQHEGLSAVEHASIFYLKPESSLTLLTRMKNIGILVERDLNYLIRPILYRPIVSVLQSKNILY